MVNVNCWMLHMKPQHRQSNNIFLLYIIILLINQLSYKSCPENQLYRIEQGIVAIELCL